MNLHALVGPVIAAVNPPLVATLQVSTGASTAADGKRTPTYTAPVQVQAQVQALTYRDITQLDGLNLQGTQRAIYLTGEVDGLIRVSNKGGDLITLSDGSVWLTTLVLEQWFDGSASTPAWCKVAVTLQNGS